MSAKLLRWQFSAVFRRMVIGYLAVLICLAGCWIFAGVYEKPGGMFLFSLSLIGVILGMIALEFVLLASLWSEMISCFYSQRAMLIRTLPLSRTQIYGTLLVNSLLQMVIFGSVALLLLRVVLSLEPLSGFVLEMYTEMENSGLLVSFWVEVFCGAGLQLVFALFCGFAGILLGYRSRSARVWLSVGYGLLIYYGTTILMTVCLLPGYLIGTAEDPALQVSPFSAADTGLQIIVIMCIVLAIGIVVLGLLVYFRLKKGVNVE